jgi:hypothetical protein
MKLNVTENLYKKGSNGKIEVTKNNSSNDSMVFESSEFELAQFDCTLIILIHLVKPVYCQ